MTSVTGVTAVCVPAHGGRSDRASHEVAAAQGTTVLHEPRLWPEYHPGYYGVFVRDPDGNNVEAVCHVPE